MVGEEKYEVAAQVPRPRIVQHNKRRYSIRLESVFWQFLEFLSERRGIRLGRFVAELADGYRGHNLSSYLRVVCMIEAERGVARAQLDPRRDSLLGLVQACPNPGVVISQTRKIIAYNDGFSEWLGTEGERLAGLDLAAALQVRTNRPLAEVWSDLLAGRRPSFQAQVLHLSAGPVKATQATVVPLRSHGGDTQGGDTQGGDSLGGEEFYAVMWLLTAPKSGSADGRDHFAASDRSPS
jgi:predicted DNA-binding ribbon-helix-helix protein